MHSVLEGIGRYLIERKRFNAPRNKVTFLIEDSKQKFYTEVARKLANLIQISALNLFIMKSFLNGKRVPLTLYFIKIDVSQISIKKLIFSILFFLTTGHLSSMAVRYRLNLISSRINIRSTLILLMMTYNLSKDYGYFLMFVKKATLFQCIVKKYKQLIQSYRLVSLLLIWGKFLKGCITRYFLSLLKMT